jgi:exopolysaccharide biosynthesis WecB/TagA/CpsF family protein
MFGVTFDLLDTSDVLARIDAARENGRFSYIVTPNVDHVVRNQSPHGIAAPYDAAWLTLCDSMPLTILAKLLGHELPRVTGSDLTAEVFDKVLRDGDRLAVIASHEEVVDRLRLQYPKLRIRVHVPPIGVRHNAEELLKCIDFVRAEPNDFVFLAIGSPQSEAIAYALSKSDSASGIGLCIGASLEFLTGMKRRAPRWMSETGLEWLHRLATDPRRLWRRYLYAIVPLMRLVAHELRLKRKRLLRVYIER